MDRPIVSFWAVSAVLLAASAFYGVQAARFKSITAPSAKLETGDVVRIAKVVDGDAVLVEKDGEGAALVRILGIKTFESKIERDPAAVFGRAAEESLRRIADGRPLRVLVHAPAKDRQGRTLATLVADDQDVGLMLLGQGLALVFSPHAFPAMPLYLREQSAARAAKRGLWADPEVAERADALVRSWQRAAP